MFSRFFIDRPIFAAVISLFLVLAGLAAMRTLPVAQYPEIAPPVVTVQAVYPGASAEVLEKTVASPIENAINGVPNMLYMSSNSSSSGILSIQVTFEIGTRIDDAAVNVNNRVKQVEPRLPEEVRRQGVSVERGIVVVPAGPRLLFARRPVRRPVHIELRDAERAGPAEAPARHDQRADLRRQGLRDAHLGQAGSSRPAQAHAGRRRRRDQRAERAILGGQGRTGPDQQGPGPGLHDHGAGAPLRRQAVRRHHRPRRSERRRRCACPTSRASSWDPRITTSSAASTASRPRWSASSCSRARMRSKSRRACAHSLAGMATKFPEGLSLRRALRHHALRRSVDPRGHVHARRGDDPRVPRRVPVPAKLARDASFR